MSVAPYQAGGGFGFGGQLVSDQNGRDTFYGITTTETGGQSISGASGGLIWTEPAADNYLTSVPLKDLGVPGSVLGIRRPGFYICSVFFDFGWGSVGTNTSGNVRLSADVADKNSVVTNHYLGYVPITLSSGTAGTVTAPTLYTTVIWIKDYASTLTINVTNNTGRTFLTRDSSPCQLTLVELGTYDLIPLASGDAPPS